MKDVVLEFTMYIVYFSIQTLIIFLSVNCHQLTKIQTC